MAAHSLQIDWLPNEDRCLRDHVNMHGCSSWQQISNEIGRSAANCKARWFSTLDPSLHVPWSPHEDAQLLRSVRLKGERWENLARNHALGRSAFQLQQRYRVVKPRRLDFSAHDDHMHEKEECVDIDVEMSAEFMYDMCALLEKEKDDRAVETTPEVDVWSYLEDVVVLQKVKFEEVPSVSRTYSPSVFTHEFGTVDPSHSM